MGSNGGRAWGGVFARALAWVAVAPVAAAQHNVCVIVIDDCGPELIGAYDQYFASIGKPSALPGKTPAIDRLLAARGILFTRAWATPVCTPSRAQMLTGRFASRTGVGSTLFPRDTTHEPGLDLSLTILPEVLDSAPLGYDRVALGKWHLASHDQIQVSPNHPLGQPAGRWFDRYAGPLFNLERPAGTQAGQSLYSNWVKYFANDLLDGSNPCTEGTTPCFVDISGNSTDSYSLVDTTDDALKVLPSLVEPWFLWVSFVGVHEPTHLVPSGLPTSGCGAYAPPAQPCDPGPSPSSAAKVRCMLEALDGQIGRLLCALDESDTTVVLVADNGTSPNACVLPYSADHAKGSVYEGGIQVPMIVRSPLVPPILAGTTCTALVNSLDVYATVCELALVDPASTPGSDSISFLPYLLGATDPQRTTNYAEKFNPNFVPDPLTGAPPAGYAAWRHDQALCDERFKLIRSTRRSHGAIVTADEFYDFSEGGPPNGGTQPPTATPDFFEQNDLLAAGAPALTAEATAALASLRGELDSRFPTLVR